MICFPNIKINLGLYITEKRKDGYHNLQTVFLPVNLFDALEIIPAKHNTTTLTISGKTVAGNFSQNIVWKAFALLHNLYPEKVSPIDIFLRKAIPMGAGLGGGSADGAFMLLLLNQYFSLQLNENDLINNALQLGSDCPFFIKNIPCFAKGRGELLSELSLPQIYDYDLMLVCPQVHISTADAFRHVTVKVPNVDLQSISSIPVQEWKNHVFNQFENSVFHQYPALEDIKNKLYDNGAVYASLSGSGAAIYGLFPKGAMSYINLSFVNATCYKLENPFAVPKLFV